MKKRLIFILNLFVISLVINAQNLDYLLKEKAVASEQLWWSYFNEEELRSFFGAGNAERYCVATYVPYGYIGGEGTTIDGLSVFFPDIDVADIQYWVSTTLPEFNGQADLETVQVPLSGIKVNQFNEKLFNNHHIIPIGGLYVGYTFTITTTNKESKYPIASKGKGISQGYFFSRTTNTSWVKHNDDLMVRILSTGQFKSNAVNIIAEDDHLYTIKDSEQTMNVKLRNSGKTPVNRVDYIVETEDKQVNKGFADVSIQSMTGLSVISIPVPVETEPAIYNRTIRITEVNGQSNESDENETEIQQYNLSKKSQFVPLFEEFTGTWCGYCVRGIVAMNRAEEQYGNKAVLIAVHEGDPMKTDDYIPVISAYSPAYPSGVINRSTYTGIGLSTVVDYINNTIDKITPASIEANASWANEEQTAIRIDTQTTFQLNITGNYAIAYILIADGLTGTDVTWAQSNFYSGETSSEPDLQYWCNQPSRVSDVIYDHVAVAAWEPMYGVAGTVDKDITAGISQTNSFWADISNNTIIQDKSKLKVATLLLNSDTGEFINAALTTIHAYDPTGIEDNYISSPQIIDRFGVDGQKRSSLHRGINIIRMSDGTTKKIFKK